MDGWSRIIIQVPALRQCAFLRPLSHFCRKPRGWRTLEEVPAPQGFLHVDQESAREGFKLPVCGWPGPRLAPCTSQVAIPMKYLTKNLVERNEVSYSICFRIVAGCPLLVGSTSPPVSWLSCIRYRCGGWGPGGFQNTDPRVENPPQAFFSHQEHISPDCSWPELLRQTSHSAPWPGSNEEPQHSSIWKHVIRIGTIAGEMQWSILNYFCNRSSVFKRGKNITHSVSYFNFKRGRLDL